MSSYLKSLDPNHLITPGAWGYRTATERREWLADHRLPTIDYCDVHNYPREDSNSFVNNPQALREFIDNRAAAAFSLAKPLVLGEFGISPVGYNGISQKDWFRDFFAANLRAGVSGAMFWILTPDPGRGFGITYTTPRDAPVLAEIKHAAESFASLRAAGPPERLTEPGRHLIPRQFSWSRDAAESPRMFLREDRSILYGFRPEQASRVRFEKIGSGPGYFWGYGMGAIEYVIPERAERRRVSEIIVRAHIQPVPPEDARPEDIQTRVTLFVNGADCGSRLVALEPKGQPLIQEWRVDGFFVRLRAMRGLPLTIRFAVQADADWPYGINISNWPEGYDNSKDAKPVEVEIRR
jgi:hypothetical protein